MTQCVIYRNGDPFLLFTDTETAISRNVGMMTSTDENTYAWRILDEEVIGLKAAPEYDPEAVTLIPR